MSYEGKVENYIKHYLEKYKDEDNRVKFISSIVTHVFPNERINFLKYFLNKNKRFEDFKNLILEESGWSSIDGDEISVFEERIKFWNLVNNLLVEMNLLEHSDFVNKKIYTWYSRIEWRNKSSFKGEF